MLVQSGIKRRSDEATKRRRTGGQAVAHPMYISKRDDRLFVLLPFANVAFATQFALFPSWVAAGISALTVLRIALVRATRATRSSWL